MKTIRMKTITQLAGIALLGGLLFYSCSGNLPGSDELPQDDPSSDELLQPGTVTVTGISTPPTGRAAALPPRCTGSTWTWQVGDYILITLTEPTYDTCIKEKTGRYRAKTVSGDGLQVTEWESAPSDDGITYVPLYKEDLVNINRITVKSYGGSDTPNAPLTTQSTAGQYMGSDPMCAGWSLSSAEYGGTDTGGSTTGLIRLTDKAGNPLPDKDAATNATLRRGLDITLAHGAVDLVVNIRPGTSVTNTARPLAERKDALKAFLMDLGGKSAGETAPHGIQLYGGKGYYNYSPFYLVPVTDLQLTDVELEAALAKPDAMTYTVRAYLPQEHIDRGQSQSDESQSDGISTAEKPNARLLILTLPADVPGVSVPGKVMKAAYTCPANVKNGVRLVVELTYDAYIGLSSLGVAIGGWEEGGYTELPALP